MTGSVSLKNKKTGKVIHLKKRSDKIIPYAKRKNLATKKLESMMS